MSALGIDHPLILVRDIEAAVRRFRALGFTVTPVGRHPWGTSTALAMFDGCLIELMSVYDEGLIDERPAGTFRFGRHIRDHLEEREGISLLALHSEDADGDEAALRDRGIACQGTIEFGRDVTLPDAGADRTATTLKIIHDPALPRLSNFLCHQHRPDLIYVPAWMDHPNGAFGIRQVTILAAEADQPRVRRRLAGLYGESAIFDLPGGFGARTGNGEFIVGDRKAVEARYGRLPAALARESQPCYVAIHVRVGDLDAVEPLLKMGGAAYRRSGDSITLTDAEAHGNTWLAFVEG
ncbi:VOC family protein [Inquilinus sp. CAU 1745]|uniref:VOC family protein n=1 Tax=Inquilinus sp. CAU 1745 TaxID=3140369 RepID=UPI00325B9EEE